MSNFHASLVHLGVLSTGAIADGYWHLNQPTLWTRTSSEVAVYLEYSSLILCVVRLGF